MSATSTPDHDRWHKFWTRLGVEPDKQEEVWQKLHLLYTEKHRKYHNFDHIFFCLGMLDKTRHFATNPSAVEVALWFHDAIYDPHRPDNEDASAKLANASLRLMEFPDIFGQQVSHLIRATTHQDYLTEDDARLVVDIDLSSLGGPWEEFKRHGEAIRHEYSFVPEKQFAEGRTKILERLLSRPQGIYYLPYFKEQYENQARINLQRAIAELS